MHRLNFLISGQVPYYIHETPPTCPSVNTCIDVASFLIIIYRVTVDSLPTISLHLHVVMYMSIYIVAVKLQWLKTSRALHMLLRPLKILDIIFFDYDDIMHL